MTHRQRITALAALLFSLTVCTTPGLSSETRASEPAVGGTSTAPEDGYGRALQPWFGDYPAMVERRLLRIAVPYSMTHYFLDGATERGISAAMGRQLERQINQREGLRTRRLHVVFIPVPRKHLLAYVADGRADVAMGSIPVTRRHEGVAFTIPFLRNAQPVLVTGPGAAGVANAEALSGQEVFLQAGGHYSDALEAFNGALREAGLAPAVLEPLDESFETDEVLEMVQVGLVPMTVSDAQLADFWAQVFPDITVRRDVPIGPPRDLAWAFRDGSPALADVLNEFLREHRPRTTFGNIITNRYLATVRWLENPTGSRDRARYERTRPLFDQYGERYDVEPLLLTALGYQESRLDQATRSPAGAIGVMQLLPATGNAMAVGDIRQLEANIHAGTRYYRYLRDERTASESLDDLNTMLFALASYNAGHTRIRRLRREAEAQGLNPDVWHDNVELLAAREIGRETVQYVNNVYRYFLALQRIEAKRAIREDRAGVSATP